MKTSLIYTVLFFNLAVLLFSCKKSDLITYEGERSLYFSIASVDSINVSFAILSDNTKDSILKIPVGLLGNQLDAAVPYEIIVDNQLTTAVQGTDYELSGPLNFPAKKSSDTIYVKVLRTKAMASTQFSLGLQLKSSPQFNNSLLDINKAKNRSPKVRIYMNDILSPPGQWLKSSTSPGTEYYLGRFTKKKLTLVTQLFDFWTFREVYDNIYLYPDYFGGLLDSYLRAQKVGGTPVLEDDGTLMQSGPYFN